jgi:hypothetical protein
MSIEDTTMNCQFLKLLLNDEVHSLSIWGLPMDYKQEMKCITDTLISVANESPHLQKLFCHYDPYLGVGDELEFCDTIKMFSCILRFVGLQELYFETMMCSDFSLGLLAEHLPKLR